jgi:hypothetical protein
MLMVIRREGVNLEPGDESESSRIDDDFSDLERPLLRPLTGWQAAYRFGKVGLYLFGPA